MHLEPVPTSDTAWHARPSDEVLLALKSDAQGLRQGEAQTRLAQSGPNQLPTVAPTPWWRRLLAQFHNLLIYVLLASALITLWLGHWLDTAVIVGVVVINAIMGLVQEGKAQKALQAVHALLASHATVLRDGRRQEIDAADLVQGDVVLLESGSRVPADLRLLRSKNLAIDEAALTGESLPSGKQAEAVAFEAPLGDRSCMAYAGTVVTVGQASGVVVATARQTEIGQIGAMVAGVADLVTPLTQRLDQFARRITGFIVVVALFTFAYGVWMGGVPAAEMFLVVVGLAVAAIPEGLPAVVTITLAIGTSIMARHNAVVRRLPAVEALGSVSVICTDKTGTLTRNEMTAVRVMLADTTLTVSGAGYAPLGDFEASGQVIDAAGHADLQRLARCALLCNDARLHQERVSNGAEGGWTLAGDPTEGALLTLALKAGLESEAASLASPRRDEIPFESDHRYMATLHHDHEGHSFVLLKGAPERLLELCVDDASGAPLDRAAWQARGEQAARDGQRVLALAECAMPAGTTELAMADITPRFTLLGLVGLMDPPRPEAVAAVADCQRAGIRVVMITGDHAVTAAAIGQQLGLKAQQALTGDQIDQLDDAVTPIARRLNPIARPLLIVQLYVLVAVEPAIALHQAEAPDVLRLETLDLLYQWVLQRAPDPLAARRVHEKPVRIVQLGTELVVLVAVVEVAIVLAQEVHRGQRRKAQSIDRRSSKDPHTDIDAGVWAGPHHKAVGACDRLTVEQRKDDQCAVLIAFCIDPELAEEGEFLLVVELASANRKPAGGEPVFLAAPQPAEIAGADERDQLVVGLGVVERIMHAEAGESETDRQLPG